MYIYKLLTNSLYSSSLIINLLGCQMPVLSSGIVSVNQILRQTVNTWSTVISITKPLLIRHC